MSHRISALLVGGLLIWARLKIDDDSIVKAFNLALLFFGFNIILGGVYILSADEENFPEWISLLHLLVGVLTFLSLAGAYLICVVSKREITDG
jgi:heme A synthase